MKKRALLGAMCIALAVLSGWLSGAYMKNTVQTLEGLLETPVSATAEEKAAAALSACAEWEKRKRLLWALVKHSDADELEERFRLLRRGAETRDEELTEEYLRLCRAALGVLLEGERLAWKNVL